MGKNYKGVKMIKVDTEHLKKFQMIKEKFYEKTEFPQKDMWKNMSEDEIWFKAITQVMVVGNIRSAEKFNTSEGMKRLLKYSSLLKLSQKEAKKRIHNVLRETGTRYVGKNPDKCRKTNALYHNLLQIKEEGGPKEFLRKLSRLNSDIEKVEYLKKKFKYIKDKGARDFLIEIGMVENVIPVDIRVRNIFKKIGIEISDEIFRSSNKYHQFEKEVLEKIVKPLNMTGATFDRMLFQAYEDIKNLTF